MAARKAAQSDGSDTPPQTNGAAPAPASGRTRRTNRVAVGPAETPALAGEIVETEAPAIHEDGSWVVADAVEVHQGGIGRAEATDIRVTQGGIGLARADRVSVLMGGVGAVMAREVSVSQGGVGSILTQGATVDQAVVRTLVAQEVEFRKPSGVLVLIAQRVSGDVRVLLDWRGALAFGAAFGVLAGLVGRGRRGR
ncbi:MAG: hypothetical protein L0227_00665 [Chloroflexi bacterium]|nr:hypothetical protein [Chloroflexota bacterium]